MKAWRAFVAILSLAACASNPTTAASSPRLQWFDRVWSDFDLHYAFFELGGIDWNALGAIYRDSVQAATTGVETARLIGAMIGRLHDYHSNLITPAGSFGPPPIAYPQHFSPQIVRDNYLADPSRPTASGRIYYARLQSGPGYVYIGSFEGQAWGAEIEQALNDMSGIASLVIDIRNNGGGNEDNGIDIAARLYDRSRVYRVSRYRNGSRHSDFAAPTESSLAPAGAVHFHGGVALITNRFNGSAAEDFMLMMRALPSAVTVGDTTLGLGSNPLTLSLDNGWKYRISQSIQSTPDGFIYQWRGLPPAVPVPWSDAAAAGGHDPYLDAALAALAKR